MGIREQLNQKPAITTGATIGIILLALIFIVYEIRGGSGPSYKVPTQRYYSDDDGASYYADDINLIAPYDHGGKQAVIANVFKCKTGSPFIAYLQRYTAKGLKAIEKAKGAPGSATAADPMMLDMLQQNETEYSSPGKGDKAWYKAGSKAADAVLMVKCPNGSSVEDLEPVMP